MTSIDNRPSRHEKESVNQWRGGGGGGGRGGGRGAGGGVGGPRRISHRCHNVKAYSHGTEKRHLCQCKAKP